MIIGNIAVQSAGNAARVAARVSLLLTSWIENGVEHQLVVLVEITVASEVGCFVNGRCWW